MKTNTTAIVLALLATCASPAQPTLPPDDPVTISPVSAALNSCAISPAGTAIVVWADDTGGTDADIVFARSNDFGASWSLPAILNSNADAPASDLDPAVATDGNGRWVVVWRSDDPMEFGLGTDDDVLFALSTDDGVTWSNAAPLVAGAIDDDLFDGEPAIAADGRGTWVVVWRTICCSPDDDLLAAHSVDGGVTWSRPVGVNPPARTDDVNHSLATDGKGKWAVIWESREQLPLDDRQILFSSSTDQGQTWTDSVTISNDNDPRRPDLATDGNGAWIAVWNSGFGVRSIQAARSIDDLGTWSEPMAVNSNPFRAEASHESARIATDAHGHWMVVWISHDSLGQQVGSDDDLIFSTSVNAGLTWAEHFTFNSNAVRDSGFDRRPDLSTAGFGRWLCTWGSTELGLVAQTPRFGDCNGNGVADVWDLLGSSEDVNANGVPDECEQDCDADGAPDALIDDCNLNLVPDGCELGAGVGLDCNENGLPDTCEQSATYQIDDGFASGLSGGVRGDWIWGVQYDAGDGDVIHDIGICFAALGELAVGDHITLFVWDDPNDDALPDDARLLLALPTEIRRINHPVDAAHGFMQFDSYVIPATPVTGSFFIGVATTTGEHPKVSDDTDPQLGRNWINFGAGTDTAAFQGSVLIEDICCIGPVNWMIRANTNDSGRQGVLDECEIAGDTNGDGAVDVNDLLTVLLGWGDCPGPPAACPGDVDNDGMVAADDLLVLLMNWS